MFSTILVAYDGSDHAKSALKVAADLAKIYGAKLHLTHTLQIDTPPIVVGALVAALEPVPTRAQIEKAGEQIIALARSEAKALGVEIDEVHLSAYEPARAILTTAEKIGADLIVLGRRGLGSIGSFALGSVSLSVSHGAKCACLTVL
ncbi:MAG: universal stress protein [Sulfitobacter sp.]